MNRTRLFLCFFVILIFAGCDRSGRLTGQVFIVTESTDNIKLGLVEILAVPADQMHTHIAQRHAHIDQMHAHIAQRDRELKERIDAATATETAILKETERRYQAQYDKLGSSAGESDGVNPQLIAARDARDGARKRLEVARVEAMRIETARLEAAGLKLEAVGLETEKTLPEILDYYLSDLPSPIARSTSDADGRFQMTVPRGESIALIARSSRRVGASRESYSWLVWTSLDGNNSSEVLMSNNNLLTAAPK